ncbi:Phosphoacetylglucosamine mutase [Orchesella cincta]|uniref:Phosphoacetylglucosamine mutase n=1 Tax=Orchesella cincta TaxID=48709 RepID=A0A1D2MVV2_ORCCI|nr:Phosphoacetylglucosamine mutase [Orchesella cincta]
MASKIAARIVEAAKAHTRRVDKYIGYGTAGFRTKADLLDHVMFRVGVVSALRSKMVKASIGVMITASHNPEEDNGVKLVDPLGEMLEPAWEVLATEIANLPDDKLSESIVSLIEKSNIDLSTRSSVIVGRDTRQSSPALCQAVIDGIKAVEEDSEIADFGIISTPILHYLVVCTNDGGKYGDPTVDGYVAKLSRAFRTLIGEDNKRGNYEPTLIIDGANGVGAVISEKLIKALDKTLAVNLVNVGPPGILNHDCGADYVKVQQREPLNVSSDCGARCASLDGDADRLIYLYFDEAGMFHMLDGDKIALLFAEHFNDLLKKSQLNLKLGMVQTAYANGSSTNYATKVLNVPVTCTPTGVKFLHHAAQEFDIGVYFEANGHGTTLFSENAVKTIKDAASSGGNAAAQELAGFLNVINSTVGDAISDLLGVEAILHSKGWSIKEWDTMYQDLPNRLLKVSVADRNLVTTTDAERRVVTPEGLQERMDIIVAKFKDGRSFVRPSGTEDVVRVYAEADTQEHADELGKEVAAAVSELCSGNCKL